MRIAIMQPYFFPYLGYFQLIRTVDKFVYLDDVAFIKKGWIHRNRLLFNKRIYLFSIPLKNVSQFRAINDTEVSKPEFHYWQRKFLASLFSFYKKQPYFNEGLALLEDVLATPFTSIADLAIASIRRTCEALHLEIPFSRSSKLGRTHVSAKEELIIDICRRYGSDIYVNPQGGTHLYSQSMFTPHGIQLEFLQPNLSAYPVKNRDFVPGLSILDALMCCGIRYTREYLLSGYGLRRDA